MTVGSVLSTAVSALTAQSRRANTAAHNIANARTEGYRAAETRLSSVAAPQPSGGGSYVSGGVQAVLIQAQEAGSAPPAGSDVNLGREFSTLIQARNAYRASVETVRTADQLSQDLIATLRA